MLCVLKKNIFVKVKTNTMSMKPYLRFAAYMLLTTAMLVSACKKKDDPKPSDSKPNAPYFGFAKVGNIMSYETSTPLLMQVYEGTLQETIISKHGTDIYAVRSVLNLGIPLVPESVDTTYWKINDSQFASVDNTSGLNLFPFYSKNDDVNTSYSLVRNGTTYERRIEAKNQSLVLDPGTFNCITIRETNNNNDEESLYYFHHGAGMVKIDRTVVWPIIGEINIEITLVDKNF